MDLNTEYSEILADKGKHQGVSSVREIHEFNVRKDYFYLDERLKISKLNLAIGIMSEYH